jgi:hypothetical protein
MWAALCPADRRNGLLITLLGVTIGGLYFVAIDLHDPAFSLSQQQHVISGIAGSPYRYRVLVPWLVEAGTHAFALVSLRDVAFLQASAVYDCLGFVAQFLALYALARQWFSPIQALVGVAFTSSVELATLGYFVYQPWSIVEVTLFSLGFLLAYRGRWGLVGVAVVLASLNRETGVFLPLALLLGSVDATHPFDIAALRAAAGRRETRFACACVLLSTGIFAGLRLVLGSAPAVDELGLVVARNLEPNNLIAAGMAVTLFLGLGWFFAWRGAARAQGFIGRIARVIPFYLLAFAVWGWWREVRILTSLYPILIPLVLAYCYLPHPRGAASLRGQLLDEPARPVETGLASHGLGARGQIGPVSRI